MHYIYLFGIFLTNALSLKCAYGLADFSAKVYFKFSGKNKVALRNNLKVVFGDDISEETLDLHVLNVYKNFARYLTDFFRFLKIEKSDFKDKVTVRGIEKVEKVLNEEKGGVLLALHLGNWELGGAVVSNLGFPLHAIVLEHANQKINDFFVKQRGVNGLSSIPLGMSVKRAFRALRNNELVAIVGDKDYTSSGIPIDFFGKKAILPKGPAIFSLKASAC